MFGHLRRIAARLTSGRVRDDRGSQMIEIAVGMMIMAVAVTSVIGSMGAGMQLVGHSRQRSLGVAVGNERLEAVHNLPYDQIGLTTAPTHSDDITNPDSDVHPDGRLEITDADPDVLCGPGDECEPIITGGTLYHIHDPRTVGRTVFSIYQYVTWFEAPSIKRFVAVVIWKFPVQSARSSRVTLSTLISDGTVDVPGSDELVGTPTPGPVPTPPPGEEIDPDVLGIGQLLIGIITPPDDNPANPCPADEVGPSEGAVTVVSASGSEQGYLNSTTMQMRLKATDSCPPITGLVANVFPGTDCDSPPPPPPPAPPTAPGPPPDECFEEATTSMESGVELTISWIIPPGDGYKRFYTRFRDNQGNYSGTYLTYIVLDQARPSAPSSLATSTCTMAGSDRSVTLNWGASTDPGWGPPPYDTNLSGYRLYKSIKDDPFQIVPPSTTSLTASDADKKSYTSLRYMVRAYDKAGNESNDSNILNFTANSCTPS